MNKLTIRERRKDSVVILDLDGQIKLGDGNLMLRAAMSDLIGRGVKDVLLNLAGVSYIDSSGLGEIIAGSVKLRKNGGRLKLLDLTTRVRELMVITKLLTVLDAYKLEADAVRSFRPFFSADEDANNRSISVVATQNVG